MTSAPDKHNEQSIGGSLYCQLHRYQDGVKRGPAFILTLLFYAIGTASAAQQATTTYQVHYHANLISLAKKAELEIRITQARGQLRWLEFSAPESRFYEFSGDGKVERRGSRVHWQIPAQGGSLRYFALIDNQRANDSYDARITPDWAIFRLGDLFPPARSSTENSAHSRSSLTMHGPDDWSIETPYGSMVETRAVDNPKRRFDRPTGWAIAGKLAIRRDRITNRKVTIASPLGQGVRRQDLLAFLHWTLPELVAVYPTLPQRLLIISAADPMWRGGLSGPASFYMHAARPLISEDSTSPPLHELVHVATSTPPADGDDWIAEGLAEYYSIEILRRSGGISFDHFKRAIDKMRARSERGGGQLSDPSKGIDSTRAAVLFHDLAEELVRHGSSIDAVISTLSKQNELNREALEAIVEGLMKTPSAALKEGFSEK